VTSAPGPVAQPAPERPMRQSGRPSWPQARTAVVECAVLAVACLITYELATRALSRVYSLSRDDDLLGGMWAVLATIFVLRDSFGKSVAAAVSRMAATVVSFVFCLIYLAFLPFHAWALAMLVGASALAVMLLGRPGDAVTAGITTAVIMVVAAVSPQHAWEQPILRLVDTVVGVAVGAIAAWTGTWVKGLLPARSAPPDPAKVKVDLPERRLRRGHQPAARSPYDRLRCVRRCRRVQELCPSTGISIESEVPLLAGLTISSRPPSASIRSASPTSPVP
jgi:hypothetical protein